VTEATFSFYLCNGTRYLFANHSPTTTAIENGKTVCDSYGHTAPLMHIKFHSLYSYSFHSSQHITQHQQPIPTTPCPQIDPQKGATNRPNSRAANFLPGVSHRYSYPATVAVDISTGTLQGLDSISTHETTTRT